MSIRDNPSSYTGRQRRIFKMSEHGMQTDKLALVIPTLREAPNLSTLLPRIQAKLDALGISYELLVVDDDSRDGTEELISAISRIDARVRLIVRRHQRGLAGAVVHGWHSTDAPILGVMDADGQHPAELLPELIEAMHAGHDLAIASRFASGSRVAWAPLRGFLTTVATSLTLPIQPHPIRIGDPLSGFFLVRRSCIHNVVFQPSGFKLLLEILARGEVRSIAEVPFHFGRRRAGRSKASLKVAWDYLLLLARLYGARLKSPPITQESTAE
jgi:dolichol-phosphate mannosyltransferase